MSAQIEERWCASRRKKTKKKRRKKKRDRDSWIRKKVFFFSFKFKTRNRVFRWEGWGIGKVGKIGIEGNRERIQTKTIVHLEGEEG